MRRRKRKEEAKDNLDRWMLTYLDLITLLAAFFILLYSMSNVDRAKYQKLAVSLNKAMVGSVNNSMIDFGGSGPGSSVDKIKPLDVEMVEQKKLQDIKKKIDEYIKTNNLSSDIETSIEDRGLVISFKDSVLFDSGKALIKPEYEKKVVEVGKILNTLEDNFIRVEGHTDTVPINNDEFASNWQLSVIRASNVTEFLIGNCAIKSDKIGAAGYGENRPKSSNVTEEGKSKNRRVDIVIVNTKFNQVENNKNTK